MNTQKTKKPLYPLELKRAELRELVDHTRKFVRGIELDLSSDEISVTASREMEKTLREMTNLLASAMESLERVTKMAEGYEDSEFIKAINAAYDDFSYPEEAAVLQAMEHVRRRLVEKE